MSARLRVDEEMSHCENGSDRQSKLPRLGLAGNSTPHQNKDENARTRGHEGLSSHGLGNLKESRNAACSVQSARTSGLFGSCQNQ